MMYLSNCTYVHVNVHIPLLLSLHVTTYAHISLSLYLSLFLGTGKQPGILPRALDVVFNSIKNNQFDSHCIKPKFYAEATYLIENEEEADKALKRSLLNQVCMCRMDKCQTVY